MLSKVLLGISLLLLGLKFGLKARLRELGRLADRIVNLLLVVIIVSYCLQIGIWFLTR